MPCLTFFCDFVKLRTGRYSVSPGTGDNVISVKCVSNLEFSGQDCSAGSRVYVQASIYDKFIKLLVQKAKEFVVGDPFDEKTAGGPLVSFPFRYLSVYLMR